MMSKLLLAMGMAIIVGFSAVAAEPDQNTRTLVHLLDYIAQDYLGAVTDDGKIKEAGEYKEMQEFCDTANSLGTNFFASVIETEIQNQLKKLHELVLAKAPPEVVSKQARSIKAEVIKVTKLPLAPKAWPDLARGAQLYLQACILCHGPEGKGDGPGGATLQPKPSNFHDAERMEQLSPFQAFNTISLGVQGTGMASFGSLPEKDIWDLSFYVVSLRHNGAFKAAEASSTNTPPSLEVMASSSDAQLLGNIPGDEAAKATTLALWRHHGGGGHADALATARTNLRAALAAYETGDFTTAKNKALSAYLDGVEPVEPRLKAVNGAFMLELEQLMAGVRTTISAHKPAAEVVASVERAEAGLDKASAMLVAKPLTPALIFGVAAGIILREGFEAVLVIVAILGVLRAIGARDAAKWVHGGWLAALLIGGLCWLGSEWVLKLGGLQRELMEAITSLVAVAILLSLGFWLHSKTEMTRWKEFIEVRIKSVLSGGNLFGLAFIAFIAVFREAVETVLFLSVLQVQGGDASGTAMGAGVLMALVLVFVLAWAMLKYSRRIPIRKLFSVSAALMGLLAVILTGKGLHSLQETGLLSITSVPTIPSSELVVLLGIYPTLETVLFQVIILVVTVALWKYGTKAVKPAAA